MNFSLSAVGNIAGRYGIAVAASAHVALLRDLCAVQVCQGHDAKHGVIYHHAEMPLSPPRWYAGKKVIGYWVVESSLAAAKAKATADACTQIWTPSEASAQALRALGSKTPVLVIPHPVVLPDEVPDRKGRDTVTTLFAFCPGWERKNPEGTIRAWQQAFPKSSALGKEARLIVKARHCGPAAVRLLELITGGDSRVELITSDVTDEQMKALYARADIFLSLHYAGAFEMHVAEAAAWGLPIVCTAVGGVLDYLPDDGAHLIPGQPMAPRMDDELNKSGEWLRPDADAAVAALETLGRSLKRRLAMGAAARESVAKLLSPRRISLRMAQALAEVRQMPAPKMTARQIDKMQTAPPPALPLTPKLRSIRAGLEVMSAEGKIPPSDAPCIISHRRSGTHLAAALLAQSWNCTTWLKTHDFPERRPIGHAALYVARNPFDCLWSNFRWWSEGGGAANDEVAAVLKGMTFSEWLNGAAAAKVGYRSCRDGQHDSFEVTRGQFFDPMRYWVDHVSAAIEAGVPVVLYEDIVRQPFKIAALISAALGREPARVVRVITEPVGIHPSSKPVIGNGVVEWSDEDLLRLSSLVSADLLQALNVRSLSAWIKQGE